MFVVFPVTECNALQDFRRCRLGTLERYEKIKMSSKTAATFYVSVHNYAYYCNVLFSKRNVIVNV